MSPEPPLAGQVADRCLADGLLASGERVVVAASGGADSSALAVLLAEGASHGLPLDLVLAHVDHGWRGAEEAAADRATVEDLGRHLGLDVEVSPPPPEPVPTEDAARRWRYRCLSAAARRHDCAKVATGHHLRDQAETVLYRLLRGSGPVGLRGVLPRRPLDGGVREVVRPLLWVDPRRLREILVERGLSWREDPSNLDPRHDRSRIRARLLAMEGRGGAASRRLAEVAERLQRRLERQESALAARLDDRIVHVPTAAAVGVPRELLAPLTPGLLHLALRHLGRLLAADRDGPWLTRRHVALVAERIDRGGAVDLPRGLILRVPGRMVWLSRDEATASPPPPYLERRDVDRVGFDLAAHLAGERPGMAAIDADRLGAAPTLRLLTPEDRFVPYTRGRARPVNIGAWLARQGVPAWLRRAQVVLEGERGIAWVPGQRIDRDHAVGADTKRVALLSLRTR